MNRVANHREKWMACLFATSLGLSLAYGMVPTCFAFGKWVLMQVAPSVDHTRWAQVFFPLISMLMFFSVPLKLQKLINHSDYRPWFRIWVPMLISLVFGSIQNQTSLFKSSHLELFVWPVILAPIGEEFLFRGWVQSVSERLFPQCDLTLTNPFPVSVWISSICFSLWHVQNMEYPVFALFQMFYSLFVGIWLADWRMRTGSMRGPITGHILLNLCSVLL